jgi:hypothetical protein
MTGKPLSMIAAAAFVLSIVAGGCAKEEAPSRPEAANREAAGKERKAAPKAAPKWFTGAIESLDAAEGTLTLKGPKMAMDFQADERAKRDLEGLEIGDKVIVKHTGKMAHSVVKLHMDNNARVRKEKEEARKDAGTAPEAKETQRSDPPVK